MQSVPSSPLIDRPFLDSALIDLSHSGTGRDQWSDAVLALGPFVARSFQRLVVVAPHPDDETLGVGGLIASTSERGGRVLVVSLTDGEAAYEQDGLDELRHDELCAAVHRLSLAATVAIDRRQLPDGGLTPMRVDPDTFEDLYAASADPYEQRKYSITIASLPRNDGTGCVMSMRCFEPGCSVGALTELLAGVAEFVVARDASTSAIAQAARRLEPLRCRGSTGS